MKLETFAMERLQSIWEHNVAWNLSESGVHPLRVESVAFHPLRNAMYFVSGGRVTVASPPEARARDLTIPRVEHSSPLVFSRDGTRLAVRRGHEHQDLGHRSVAKREVAGSGRWMPRGR